MSEYRVQEPESGLRKVKATIEYDGTRYAGFQGQPNQLTIQKELEQALAAVTQEETKVVGAGRTDAGVHAKGQVVHFVTAWKRSLDELQRAFNALLPRDIAVRQMTWVTPDFHARFSAVSREYRYTILNRQVRSPLEARYAYQYASALDAGAMAEAVRCLLGRHDFASFGQPTQGDSTVREAIHASCARENDHIYVDLTANAFLRRMVRTVVGTLVLVGAGRMSPPDVNRILQARDRSQAGAPAPAHGLCLMTVNYQGVKE